MGLQTGEQLRNDSKRRVFGVPVLGTCKRIGRAVCFGSALAVLYGHLGDGLDRDV
jgi:hypothetical protein